MGEKGDLHGTNVVDLGANRHRRHRRDCHLLSRRCLHFRGKALASRQRPGWKHY